MGISERNPTKLPSSTLAETSLAMDMLEILMPFLAANVSTENLPLRSVAVVIIGSDPRRSAIFAVSSLHPPMCPDSRAIAHLPCSSIPTTAGSTVLLLMYGAMYLTAIPMAPMKTIASHSPNDLPVHSPAEPSILSTPRLSDLVLQNILTSSSASASFSLRAVLHPFVENAMALILIPAPS